MANISSLQETILKAIDAVVTQRNNELKLDKTITGIIKKNMGSRNGKPLYQVEYSGGLFEAVTQGADDIYIPHNSVYILIPEGNFSNEKIIIGRTSTINVDRSDSIVAAAINKYSIVGSNLLKTANNIETPLSDQIYGLRSYHSRNSTLCSDLSHYAQFLYRSPLSEGYKDEEHYKMQCSDDKMQVYKNESTALMIKADFRTNLNSEQKTQSGARYGLIFNFSFDNLNKGYGETNGEILNTVSNIVKGPIQTFDENTSQYIIKTDTLSNVINDFEQHLARRYNDDNNPTYWTTDDVGYIDQLIETITVMYFNNFKINYAELDRDIINNTIEAYINLLKDFKQIPIPQLKESNTENERYNAWFESIQTRNNLWKQQKVGEAKQKIEQFVLTSDDMLGNPFNFNNWSTQYSVFEVNLDTFSHLDSILFYKEGFIESDTKEQNWPLNTTGDSDIFVKNIQIYAMNPLDNQSGDYSLKIEPKNGSDIFISNNVPELTLKATVLRKFYEDLSLNDAISYQWFKQNSSVINANSDGYDALVGAGWKETSSSTNIRNEFYTTLDKNRAYKNVYQCVVHYAPMSGDEVYLFYEFTIYNLEAKIDVMLESDLGTNFSFDAGSPTITVKIDNNRGTEQSEFNEIVLKSDVVNPPYLYSWSIKDSANDYDLFLDETFSNVKIGENTTVTDAMIISAKKSQLQKIEAYYLEEIEEDDITRIDLKETTDGSKATRIIYPMSISSTGCTITCYVKYYNEEAETYYDIGSASLEFINTASSFSPSDYIIKIENGSQVFQYDEYGNTPCSEKKKNPLEVQPLKAKLYTPSGIEVKEGSNYNVEWIFPIENSMLTTTAELVRNPATNLPQLCKGFELPIGITDIYDPDAYDNQITCHVSFNGKDIYETTNFYFGKQGSNGTNGTDVIAKIVYAQSNDYFNILHSQPLTLYVQNYEDFTKNKQAMLNVGDKQLSMEVPIASLTDSSASRLKTVVYQKNEEVNIATGYPHWTIAGSIKNIAKNFNNTNGDLIWKSNTYPDSKRLQNIRSEVKINGSDQTYYAFYSLPIIEYEELSTEKHIDDIAIQNRIAIDKQFYLNEIIYNADGRNPIYNHNQGLKLINLPDDVGEIRWTAICSNNSNDFNSNGVSDIYLIEEKNQTENTTELLQNYRRVLANYRIILSNYESVLKEYETKSAKNEADKLELDYDNQIIQLENDWNIYKDTYETNEAIQEHANKWAVYEEALAAFRTDTNGIDPEQFTDEQIATQKDLEIQEAELYDWETKRDIENQRLTKKEAYLENKNNELIAIDAEIAALSKLIRTTDEEGNETGLEIDLKNIVSELQMYWTITTYPQNKEAMIYVVPQDTFDGSDTGNMIKAELYNNAEDKKLIATVYAPIHMALNTFGLASLNAWDGNTVTIDEDNGYVMAPQIGAGEKDSNNRFTGILMGKTETYTGHSAEEKETGLFGYCHGLQSIFLDANTGNATFGLPNGYTFNETNGTLSPQEDVDNYNEGRIELRPGDVSKIGGWRLGRRSFYYLVDNREIGNGYQNDFIPNKRGSIAAGDKYNSHHEKDIPEDASGILLHSGENPYISIKGKPLNIKEDGLDDSSESYLMDNDSLEIQMDPKTPTLFTIFRHNGQVRYRDPKKDPDELNDPSNILYPEGSRTYLAGINARGQLVANSLQTVTKPTTNSEDIVTTFAVSTVAAFGEVLENASHVGLKMEASNSMIGKIFIKNSTGNDIDTSTLFITGSGSSKDEYTRSISIHGEGISLYAKNSKPNGTNSNNEGLYTATSTDSNIKITTNNYQTQLGNTIFKLTRDSDNILNTRGKLDINLGFSNEDNTVHQWNTLNIKALGTSEKYIKNGGEQYYNKIIGSVLGINDGQSVILWKEDIESTAEYRYKTTNVNYGIFTEAQYKETDNGSEFDISKSTEYNHLLMKKDILTLGRKGTLKNYITLDESNGSWETNHDLRLENKNQLRILATNTGNGSQYNSTSAQAQILIQAGTIETNQNVAQLFLNSSNNSWTTGSDSGVYTGNKQNSWFRINETRTNNGIYLYNKIENDVALTYFGVDVSEMDISGGISIQGSLTGNTSRGLSVVKNNKNAGGWIYAQEGFTGGNPKAICDGNSQGVSGGGTNSLGQSFTIRGPRITLQSNGRPKIEEDNITITYSMPSASDVGAYTKEEVNNKISSFVTRSTVVDLINRAVKNHSHPISYYGAKPGEGENYQTGTNGIVYNDIS